MLAQVKRAILAEVSLDWLHNPLRQPRFVVEFFVVMARTRPTGGNQAPPWCMAESRRITPVQSSPVLRKCSFRE